jgi:hypothetical protein
MELVRLILQRAQWLDVLNTVISFRVSLKAEYSGYELIKNYSDSWS